MQLSLSSIKISIASFFKRYHFVIFIISAAGSLTVAIFLLNQVVEVSAKDNGYVSQTNNTVFDTQTIEKLRDLKSTEGKDSQIKFSGRTNPFVE